MYGEMAQIGSSGNSKHIPSDGTGHGLDDLTFVAESSIRSRAMERRTNAFIKSIDGMDFNEVIFTAALLAAVGNGQMSVRLLDIVTQIIDQLAFQYNHGIQNELTTRGKKLSEGLAPIE